ncbi:hypothetical protein PBRA_007901, partial [Plasmodiophora brassicae]
MASSPRSHRRQHRRRANVDPRPACPCQVVTRRVMADLDRVGSARVSHLAALAANQPVAFPPDTPIDILLQTVSQLCEHCVHGILRALQRWRNERHSLLLAESASAQVHSAVDIVFAEACIAALSRYDGPIDESFAVHVEGAAIEHMRREAQRLEHLAQSRPLVVQWFSCSDMALPTGRPAYLLDLWTLLIGHLSQTRLNATIRAFLGDIDREDTHVAVQLVRGLRAVQLSLETEDAVEQSMDVVRALLRLMEATQRPAVRDAVTEALTAILYPLAVQPPITSVTLTKWYALMTHIYVDVRRRARKPRQRPIVYPLMTVVLCVCEPEHFITNFGVLLEALIAFYDERDTRLIALACMQRLLHVYLEQVAFRKNATSNNLDTVVRRVLFGAHRRLPYADGTHQMEHDGMVALILTVAEGKFDYCLEEVIVRMLTMAGTDCINEYVQLALRALIAIFDRGEQRMRLFTSTIGTLVPPGFRLQIGPSIPTTLDAIDDRLQKLQTFRAADLGACADHIGARLGQILVRCHSLVGETLLTDEHAEKSAAAAMSSDAVIAGDDCFHCTSPAALPSTNVESVTLPIVVYRFALSALPFVGAPTVPDADLLRMICQALIHVNPGVRAAAAFVVDHIHAGDDDDLRVRFLSRLADYLLSEVPIGCVAVALHLLDVVARIAEKANRPAGPNVEGSALLWLTSSSPRVRLTCLRILDSVRRQTEGAVGDDLGVEVGDDDDDDVVEQIQAQSPSAYEGRRRIRLSAIELIESHEDAIVAAASRRSLPELEGVAACSESTDQACAVADRSAVIALCERSSAIRVIHAATCASDQDRWSLILAEVARSLVGGDGIRVAGAEAALRLTNLIMGKSKAGAANSSSTIWQQRNIGILALATRPTRYCIEATIQVVRSSSSSSLLAAICTTALGNVAPDNIDVVLGSLGAGDADGPEVRLRCAHVHSLLAEGVTSELLHDNDTLRMRFTAWIERTRMQLERHALGCGAELQHFSVVVERIAGQCYAAPSSRPLDHALRVSTFTTLARIGRGQDATTLAAMAALLLGPYFEADGAIPDAVVFPWVHSALRNPRLDIRDVGSLALHNLLTSCTSPALVTHYLANCYGGDSIVARRYFLVLGEFWMNDIRARIPLPELVHLVVYKLGDSSFTVRSMALDMIPVLAEKRPGRVSGRHAPHMIVTSRLQDSYLQAQVEISSRLAHEYADCRSEFVATLSRYLPAVPSMDKLIMLRYGQPWIHGIDLAGPLGNNILELLFRVSVEHGTHFAVELQSIWRELARTVPSNVIVTLRFLVLKCSLIDINENDAGSRLVIDTSKRIALYLSRVAPTETIQTMIAEIEDDPDPVLGHVLPAAAASAPFVDEVGLLHATLQRLDQQPSSEKRYPVHHLYPPSEVGGAYAGHRPGQRKKSPVRASTVPMGKPSSSAVALMLLVEVAYEMDPSVLSPFQSHIMFMIHVALIALDHDVFAIRDSAKFILVNLIHAVSFRGMPDADADSNRVNEDEHRRRVARRSDARRLMDKLMSTEGKAPWPREMISESNLTLRSADAMASVVESLVRLCDVDRNGVVARQWARHALRWATRFRARSPLISSRSYQICRILTDTMDVPELHACVKELEPALSVVDDVVSDILATLVVTCDRLPKADARGLGAFPALLWRCVDLIGNDASPGHVFVHAASLLILVLDKIEVDDQAVRIAIMRMRPAPFSGLQPLVLRGLSREVTRQPAWVLLSRLTASTFGAFIDPSDSRILVNVAALLPWLEQGTGGPASVAAIRGVRRACEQANPDMGVVMAAYERGRLDSLSEAVGPPMAQWMKHYGDARPIAIWTDMLRDGPVDLQRHVLVLLGSVLTHLDWTCAQIRGPQGLTLVQTLLDLQDSHPALRPETIRCVEVVLQRTCGSHACVPWLNAAGDDDIAGSRSASPVASRQPSLPPAPGSLPPPGPPSAAPRPISPTPAPAFSPVRPARTNAPDLGAAGAPPGSPSPAR